MKQDHQILDLLTEESAEIIQTISKIKRFGLDSIYDGKTNQESFQQEFADFILLCCILNHKYPEYFKFENLDNQFKIKFERLKKYLPFVKNINISELIHDNTNKR